MKLSIEKNELVLYLTSQLNIFFPDKNKVCAGEIASLTDNALDRIEFCFSHTGLKYYKDGEQSVFNHLNSDHYCMFLWFVSNEAYLHGKIYIAEKLFYMNKMLNGVDMFYSIKLPEIFLVVHPLGSVIGNASYKNYLIIYQNVTIGSNPDGKYPVLSEKLILYSKSSIIGNCNLGENVVISSGTSVISENIPSNSLVFGQSRNLIIKPETKNLIKHYFLC